MGNKWEKEEKRKTLLFSTHKYFFPISFILNSLSKQSILLLYSYTVTLFIELNFYMPVSYKTVSICWWLQVACCGARLKVAECPGRCHEMPDHTCSHHIRLPLPNPWTWPMRDNGTRVVKRLVLSHGVKPSLNLCSMVILLLLGDQSLFNVSYKAETFQVRSFDIKIHRSSKSQLEILILDINRVTITFSYLANDVNLDLNKWSDVCKWSFLRIFWAIL